MKVLGILWDARKEKFKFIYRFNDEPGMMNMENFVKDCMFI